MRKRAHATCVGMRGERGNISRNGLVASRSIKLKASEYSLSDQPCSQAQRIAFEIAELLAPDELYLS